MYICIHICTLIWWSSPVWNGWQHSPYRAPEPHAPTTKKVYWYQYWWQVMYIYIYTYIHMYYESSLHEKMLTWCSSICRTCRNSRNYLFLSTKSSHINLVESTTSTYTINFEAVCMYHTWQETNRDGEDESHHVDTSEIMQNLFESKFLKSLSSSPLLMFSSR
jgi:hypothetical protein